MTSLASGALDRLRRPEYTGANRCVPCTAVNLVIAVVTAGALAAAGWTVAGSAAGWLLGAGAFTLSAAAIYLRGYLVPGTPRLTKTYFPDRVLRWFDKQPAGVAPDGEIDPETVLMEAGAVTDCEHEDDLCLTGEFRTAWRERIADLREGDAGRGELATVLDVDPDRLTFEEHGEAFAARLDGRRAGQWESRAAFLADVAGARELRSRYGPWSTMDVRERSAVLGGLRIFLERCPDCDGPVSIGREVVESCCRSIDVVAVTCRDCGARMLEAEQPG